MHLDRAGRKLSQDGQMGIRREDTLLVVSPFIKKTQTNNKKPQHTKSEPPSLCSLSGNERFQIWSPQQFFFSTSHPETTCRGRPPVPCFFFVCDFHANLLPKGYKAVPPPSPLLLQDLRVFCWMPEYYCWTTRYCWTVTICRDAGMLFLFIYQI